MRKKKRRRVTERKKSGPFISWLPKMTDHAIYNRQSKITNLTTQQKMTKKESKTN